MSFSIVLLGSAGFRVWLTSAEMATSAALVFMLPSAEMTLEWFPSPPPPNTRAAGAYAQIPLPTMVRVESAGGAG